MGNTHIKSGDVEEKLDSYKPGDVRKFEEIMNNIPDSYKSDPKFKAWKLSCMYYFILNFDEDQHNIGVNLSTIIQKFGELEAKAFTGIKSDDPSVRQSSKDILHFMHLATGKDEYAQAKNNKVSFST